LHDIPGRLRIGVPGEGEPDGALRALTGLRGVALTRWSPRTRSLLVLYDVATTTAQAVRETIESHVADDPGTWIEIATPTRMGNPLERPAVRLTAAIRHTARELDTGISAATGGWLDLKLLVPLALFGWALQQLARGQAGALAWSSALWYAHGLFRDYNIPNDQE